MELSLKVTALLFHLMKLTDPHPSGWLIAPGVGATAYTEEKSIVVRVDILKSVLFESSIPRKLKPDSMYYFGVCELHGKIRTDIIAYADFNFKNQFSGVVYEAWRIDFKKQKIVDISTTGLRCVNESYPGDGD